MLVTSASDSLNYSIGLNGFDKSLPPPMVKPPKVVGGLLKFGPPIWKLPKVDLGGGADTTSSGPLFDWPKPP